MFSPHIIQCGPQYFIPMKNTPTNNPGTLGLDGFTNRWPRPRRHYVGPARCGRAPTIPLSNMARATTYPQIFSTISLE